MSADDILRIAESALLSAESDDALFGLVDQIADFSGAIFSGIVVTDPNFSCRAESFFSAGVRRTHTYISDIHSSGEDGEDVEGVKSLYRLPRNKIFTERQVYFLRGGETLPSSFIRTVLEKYCNVHQRSVVHLNSSQSCFEYLFIHTDSRTWAEEIRRAERLESISPIVAGAMRLRRERRQLAQAATSAVEAVACGAIVVASDLTVLFANASARDMLDQHDGMSIDRTHRLRLSSQDAECRLRQAIAPREARGLSVLSRTELLLRVERPSGRQAFLLTIRPAGRTLLSSKSDPGIAVVLVHDSAAGGALKVETFADAATLSRAETAVCQMLLDGLTVRQIADARDVSIETIKTQTKSIYCKLRVNSRSELVRAAAIEGFSSAHR